MVPANHGVKFLKTMGQNKSILKVAFLGYLVTAWKSNTIRHCGYVTIFNSINIMRSHIHYLSFTDTFRMRTFSMLRIVWPSQELAVARRPSSSTRNMNITNIKISYHSPKRNCLPFCFVFSLHSENCNVDMVLVIQLQSHKDQFLSQRVSGEGHSFLKVMLAMSRDVFVCQTTWTKGFFFTS